MVEGFCECDIVNSAGSNIGYGLCTPILNTHIRLEQAELLAEMYQRGLCVVEFKLEYLSLAIICASEYGLLDFLN